MNPITAVFSLVTIATHTLFFIVESFLWLRPAVHERVLGRLDSAIDVSLYEQAQILQSLFYNQGFYNLFVALGGVAGWVLYKKGKTQSGLALITYMCLFAVGAALVLAYSIGSYSGAAVQGLPPLLALIGIAYTAKSK